MKKNRGFTLLEILVVLAITLLVAALILANLRSGQKKYQLAELAQGLASDLRQAQGMAISGAQTTGFATIGGYGVRVTSASSYEIFLTSSSVSCDSIASRQSVKVVNLSSPVQFTNSASPINEVFFIPPRPLTCITVNNSTSQTQITFTLSGNGNQANIVVNNAGKIDIQ